MTHAEIQAVLFGKHKDIALSLTGHDPAQLSNHATLCIANVDALAPHEQDLVATFLQKHRKEHAGMRVILTVREMTKVAIDVGAFEGVEVRVRNLTIPGRHSSPLRRACCFLCILRVFFIERPLQRVIGDIRSNLVEIGFIADDVVVKAALPCGLALNSA